MNTKDIFIDSYDGFAAIKLRKASAVTLLECDLTKYGLSYQTKITTTKKRGIEFVVMLIPSNMET